MKKFIQFEVHEYMDMYPRTTVQSMEESKAQEYANYMNTNYSGGTTRLKKVFNKEEAAEYVIKTINEVLKDPTVTTTDASLSGIDVDFIKNLIKEFNICYK